MWNVNLSTSRTILQEINHHHELTCLGWHDQVSQGQVSSRLSRELSYLSMLSLVHVSESTSSNAGTTAIETFPEPMSIALLTL